MSYLLVTLQSILGNILDVIFLARLMDAVEDHKLLPKEQSGFRNGRSTKMQVARILHQVKKLKRYPKSRITLFYNRIMEINTGICIFKDICFDRCNGAQTKESHGMECTLF